MTVAGVVDRCGELGLTHIGIMDHLAPDRGWSADGLKAIFADFEGLSVPSGMSVYRGAEVDITERGCLPDLPELRDELRLDYVIGSVHVSRREGASDEEYIRRQFDLMMQVLTEPSPIDILGHPWGGRLVGHVAKDMLVALLEAATAQCVGVEVSPCFGADEADLRLLVGCALEAGTRLAPVSDAHAYEHLGDTAELQPVLDEGGARTDDLWLPRSA
jgi:histidinol phosphatase-like PHP family hydrolase